MMGDCMLATIAKLPHTEAIPDNTPAAPSSAEILTGGDVKAAPPQEDATQVPVETAVMTPAPRTPSNVDETEDEEDPIASLENDSDDFQRATISIVMTLLPTDHHPDGRLTLIGVRSHSLPPHLTTARFNDLLPLPESLSQALSRWEETFSAALTARKTQRDAKAAEQQARTVEQEQKREAERQARKSKAAKPTAAKAPPVAQKPKPAREQDTQDSTMDTAIPQAGLFE